MIGHAGYSGPGLFPVRLSEGRAHSQKSSPKAIKSETTALEQAPAVMTNISLGMTFLMPGGLPAPAKP